MADLPEKLTKPYQPNETEGAIYKRWEESGFFNPDNLPARHQEPYSTLMPPPNANGRLHAGHGLDIALKDAIIRFQRMRGKKTLYLPGSDHAGFETQMVFEKKLEKEGRSRHDLSPQQLYEEIMAFTLENKAYMEDDVRKLGASCDWSRNTFMLDPKVVARTQETFIKMYEDGLIYRGERIIHWNPKHQTSLSDVETEFIEQEDPFYFLQYGPFVIATVRPETKFGDKYVVMHPNDARYKEYKHGQTFELEWINGPITATVIKDESIDMEFGSGVMTITPWHSQTDFDIAERHGLEKEQIIDFSGKLLPSAGDFAGLHWKKARPLIIEKLKSKGLLVKVDEHYKHTVRIDSRTNVPIEPQIRAQWFVKMKPLTEMVIKAVEEENKIAFLPDHQKKVLLHWMHNTIDWNISRQIVWGIPIPAWFHASVCIPRPGHEEDVSKCESIVVSMTKPECEFCDAEYAPDPDTFDTWFSSGQWPLTTLGYPNGADFKAFYPTDLMETGSDLVFKWVPRMIMFGLYLGKDIPFKTVYFHGMVTDNKGKKMSKSKGNVISPVEMSEKYGADAFRMALTVGNTPGGTVALSEDKIRGYKHFANKAWNITRFVFSSGPGSSVSKEAISASEDEKLLQEFNATAQEVTDNFETYQLHLASEKIYHYIWHTFADKIIEESKPILLGADVGAKRSREALLLHLWVGCLKLLHPFMPFITEEIWSLLPEKERDEELLMISKWPV
ncbi:MAG: valine--tRNA ligase [Parcubacteria group bacterium]|nr:valine--tRNA ligase [Parcubacteria group bacterium]